MDLEHLVLVFREGEIHAWVNSYPGKAGVTVSKSMYRLRSSLAPDCLEQCNDPMVLFLCRPQPLNSFVLTICACLLRTSSVARSTATFSNTTPLQRLVESTTR